MIQLNSIICFTIYGDIQQYITFFIHKIEVCMFNMYNEYISE